MDTRPRNGHCSTAPPRRWAAALASGALCIAVCEYSQLVYVEAVTSRTAGDQDLLVRAGGATRQGEAIVEAWPPAAEVSEAG